MVPYFALRVPERMACSDDEQRGHGLGVCVACKRRFLLDVEYCVYLWDLFCSWDLGDLYISGRKEFLCYKFYSKN